MRFFPRIGLFSWCHHAPKRRSEAERKLTGPPGARKTLKGVASGRVQKIRPPASKSTVTRHGTPFVLSKSFAHSAHDDNDCFLDHLCDAVKLHQYRKKQQEYLQKVANNIVICAANQTKTAAKIRAVQQAAQSSAPEWFQVEIASLTRESVESEERRATYEEFESEIAQDLRILAIKLSNTMSQIFETYEPYCRRVFSHGLQPQIHMTERFLVSLGITRAFSQELLKQKEEHANG